MGKVKSGGKKFDAQTIKRVISSAYTTAMKFYTKINIVTTPQSFQINFRGTC